MRTITINAVLNGFIVNVGCQTVVFESLDKLISELEKYLAYPKDTEKRYSENALHKHLLTLLACTELDNAGARIAEARPPQPDIHIR